jgi:SM-20-related protein
MSSEPQPPPENDRAPEAAAGRRLTREQLIDGLELFIVDDLITGRQAAALSGAMATMPFRKTEIDRRGTRFRGFVTDFPVAEIGGHFLVRTITEEVARFFAGERVTLDRAYCNNNVFGDMSHPHRDSPVARPRDITALFYVNERWDKEWGGETIFYDNQGDSVVCIAPRAGRLALFRSCIEHRNGIPSRECYEPRLTFVMKYRAEGPVA